MCGITGLLSLQGAPIDPTVLQRMTDRQAHRGPDGEGFLLGWEGGSGFAHKLVPHTREWDGRAPVRLALGHRRLAILDLSDRGLQPMSAGDGKCWIVFNGEIYNHRELRTELEGRGYAFGTRTDTEVLLQAYREWGEDCLARLQGMYAFAIWDGASRRLFAARDRLGIKPFYYATPEGVFAFASEMKALLACPGLDTTPDDEAVVGFLIHANCDYGARTLLRSVKALPPGHCLTVHAATGQVDVRGYWQLTPEHANGVRDSVRLDGLRTLLTSTMQSHLVSDVRAGSCLSGGIDSSTVVSLIGKIWREQPDQATALGDRFLTFTSCWKYPELDERTYADVVARSAGAESHLVFPSAEDFWETFPKMAWHQDMPFASLSYYAQWSVMRTARDAGVKVLLDGQGGDEVFGGYAKFRYAYLASLLRSGRLLRFAREAGAMLTQGDLYYVLNLRRGYRYLPTRLRRLLGADSLLELGPRAGGREHARDAVVAQCQGGQFGWGANGDQRDAAHPGGRHHDGHPAVAAAHGRSLVHGVLSRGARSAPRSPARRVRHFAARPPEGAPRLEQIRHPRGNAGRAPRRRAAAHEQARLRRARPALAGARPPAASDDADRGFTALRAVRRRRGAAPLVCFAPGRRSV